MSSSAVLSVRLTDGVASLLDETASCSGVSEAVREEAAKLRGTNSIAWSDLKSIVEAYKKANPGKPIYLHQLCNQKDILLQSPPPKDKSPELQARLARLQEQLDNKRYSDMVADITSAERKAEEMRNAILPSAQLQLSFGAHVLVTMFTFWAVAYYGSKYYFSYDELWAGLSGALGLTIGLLVETGLLIVRSNLPAPLEERMPDLFDKAKVREAFDKLREMKQAEKAATRSGTAAAPGGKQQRKQQGGAQGRAGPDAESKKGR